MGVYTKFSAKVSPISRVGFHRLVLTVSLQSPWLTAPASRLVNGLDNKDILGATLQTVHRVVVLLDVGNNHPALQRVTQTCEETERRAR